MIFSCTQWQISPFLSLECRKCDTSHYTTAPRAIPTAMETGEGKKFNEEEARNTHWDSAKTDSDWLESLKYNALIGKQEVEIGKRQVAHYPSFKRKED